MHVVMFYLYVQKKEESPELVNGAVKAVQDLYDIVRHDVLSYNMRSVILFLMCQYLQKEVVRHCFNRWQLLGNTMKHGISYQKQGQKAGCLQS